MTRRPRARARRASVKRAAGAAGAEYALQCGSHAPGSVTTCSSLAPVGGDVDPIALRPRHPRTVRRERRARRAVRVRRLERDLALELPVQEQPERHPARDAAGLRGIVGEHRDPASRAGGGGVEAGRPLSARVAEQRRGAVVSPTDRVQRERLPARRRDVAAQQQPVVADPRRRHEALLPERLIDVARPPQRRGVPVDRLVVGDPGPVRRDPHVGRRLRRRVLGRHRRGGRDRRADLAAGGREPVQPARVSGARPCRRRPSTATRSSRSPWVTAR